ncbi:MAG: hypothetical protein MPW15_06855 [Candidatus Manganitrophus sp.]|nr:hypothetical protein [Candidatus Manganitrophus sp.]
MPEPLLAEQRREDKCRQRARQEQSSGTGDQVRLKLLSNLSAAIPAKQPPAKNEYRRRQLPSAVEEITVKIRIHLTDRRDQE